MARQTKLTPEVTERIVSAIRVGVPHVTAAAAAGINPSTLRLWLANGAKGKSQRYIDFAAAVRAAEAEAEARMVALVAKAGLSDWKAAAWMLARRYPERYGQRRETDGEDRRRPVEIVFANVGDARRWIETPEERRLQGAIRELPSGEEE